MDERKIYSLIVTLVCFVLMALIIVGCAIYQAIHNDDNADTSAANPPTIVETNTNP